MKNNKAPGTLSSANLVIDNPWQSLKKHTAARIALGRAGGSVPTAHHLAFQLDHALARDAVHKLVPWQKIHPQLESPGLDILHLRSQAEDRQVYLQRPDLGRRLGPDSVQCLQQWRRQHNENIDVCLVVADGLSAPAIENQAVTMVHHLLKDFADHGLTCPAVFTVAQGRVAIGDEIAQLLNAPLLVVLIGERPGLSAPDSLGIYFTYQAHVGLSDERRNCLSNVRAQGLGFAQASQRLNWLIEEARRLHTSGVSLKDNSQQQGDKFIHHPEAEFRLD